MEKMARCCFRSISNNARTRRFFIGLMALSAVVILWVGSAELTQYIFQNQSFDKPFFTTYTKTLLFMMYFTGFLFYKPWQLQCGLCIMQATPNEPRAQKTYINEEPSESSKLNPDLRAFDHNSSYSSRSDSPTQNAFLTGPVYENMTDDDVSTTGSEVDIADRVQRRVRFNRIREIRHLSGKDVESSLLSRLSYSSLEDFQEILSTISNRVPFTETIKLALMFCVLWMIGSYCYQAALSNTSAAATNILSSTSGFFTLVFAAIFPTSAKDKFTLSKFIVVMTSIGGISLVSYGDPNNRSAVNEGAIFALLGAIFYGLYLVMVTRKVGNEKTLDIPLFFSFVGFFAAVFFWPFFFILHYTGIEKFELPPTSETWTFIIINGIFGTIVAELLWLWGCFLTSSLIGTMALGLVTPVTVVWDICVNRVKFSWMFFGGTIPVFISFFGVTILGHYGDWDPALDLLKKLKNALRSEEHPEQSESLMKTEIETEPENETKACDQVEIIAP